MPQKVTFQSHGLALKGELYLPSDSSSKKRAAIVVGHPFGGVKEQTAGLYAKHLSSLGFIALTFDAGYQGESEGEPRYLEDPFARSEDFKSAVSYLTTLDQVDPERIGALGICASGGYVPFTAQTERRIKAVATISAADIGQLYREGLGGTQSQDDLKKNLEEAGKERTKEARGAAPRLEHIVPNTVEDAAKAAPPRTLFREGTDYYCTSRAQHPNSQNWYVFRSLDQLVSFSAFDYVELISPHPLLLIAGTDADTLYFSEIAYKKAKEPKELFLIDGATHIDLYDKEQYVGPAVKKLDSFFTQYLSGN